MPTLGIGAACLLYSFHFDVFMADNLTSIFPEQQDEDLGLGLLPQKVISEWFNSGFSQIVYGKMTFLSLEWLVGIYEKTGGLFT